MGDLGCDCAADRAGALAFASVLARQRVTVSPPVAGIIGAGRWWTAWMISGLSIPRRYALVMVTGMAAPGEAKVALA